MYFIQRLDISTGVWKREKMEPFTCLLDALEECDELNEDLDDGQRSYARNQYRVVDEEATVMDYSRKAV